MGKQLSGCRRSRPDLWSKYSMKLRAPSSLLWASFPCVTSILIQPSVVSITKSYFTDEKTEAQSGEVSQANRRGEAELMQQARTLRTRVFGSRV